MLENYYMLNTIETERLFLRPFRIGDEVAMFKNWTTDERVAKYCKWHPHKSIEETKQYLDMCINADYCLAITLNGGNDETIGAVDLVGKNDNGAYEIGYVLMHDYWGKGIMTEAVRAVIKCLFDRGFNKLAAKHHVNNPASGRVLEKCGMKYVGNSVSQKKFGSEELCEVKCYEITMKE